MKTIILFTIFIALSASVFSQPTTTDSKKPDTTKKAVAPVKAKPVFNFDNTKVYHLTLDLTAEQIGFFTIKRNEWDLKVSRNPQLSGFQIGNIEDFDSDTKKNLQNQLVVFQKAEIEKFKADTTLLFHPKQKIK